MKVISTIGAYDARTHFSQLLERVEAGDEITITRHGHPIARLVPVRRQTTEAERREIVAKIRKLAARQSLNGLTIKSLRDEGRR